MGAALMRVNHAGEVAAQALYRGQAFTTRDPVVRQSLISAALEEQDHLAWCQQRIGELGGRTSLFGPLWYGGSFAIGAVAGLLSKGAGLGFVVETERQVEKHLASHLAQQADGLPQQDEKSRAIVEQMRQDEIAHGEAAKALGAQEPPPPVQKAMQAMAKVMTSTAYYL